MFRAIPGPLLALLTVLMPAPAGAATPAAAIDRIAAVVNDEVITVTEFQLRLREVRRQLTGQRVAAPPEDRLRRQVLERLIIETLQLQAARRLGIKVTDDLLDRAIENIARKNNLPVDALYRSLRQEGVERDAYRNRIRDQITIQQLLEREIHGRVTVSDSEIEAHLARSEIQASAAVEYNLSHILISLPDAASPDVLRAAQERTEAVARELRQGADFRQTAVIHSQGQSALEGGELGWKTPGQLPTLFAAAVRKLRPGEVSEVLRSPNGFHILRLNDTRGQAKSQTVTQTRARHILLRTSDALPADEAARRLEQLRLRVDQGEDFAALARIHSEDPASAATDGEIGWVSPGQTAPEFEKAMNSLKPQEVSAPVRTSYGVHLIQVLARRDHDITEERSQIAAREQLHARKADERYEQWLRQLRDEAYVEYRLDDAARGP